MMNSITFGFSLIVLLLSVNLVVGCKSKGFVVIFKCWLIILTSTHSFIVDPEEKQFLVDFIDSTNVEERVGWKASEINNSACSFIGISCIGGNLAYM